MDLKGRCALITGATSGIGEATARRLARAGCRLVLTGRRKERLTALAQELKKWAGIQTFAFDIRQLSALRKMIASPQFPRSEIDILINNAGLALGVEGVAEGRLKDWDTMLDTNVRGLWSITRELLPLLQQRNRADIVIIGSVAGRWVYPGGAVYCATKHAIRAFSEGLRMDLAGQRIRVINVEPGMVHTEFSEVRLQDHERAEQVYANMTPLRPEDIAETIAWTLTRPPHVNVQELVIFPTDQAAVGQVYRRTAHPKEESVVLDGAKRLPKPKTLKNS